MQSPMTGASSSDSASPDLPPSDRPPRSELHKRIASAVTLAVAAVAVTWFGGVPFALLWATAGACVTAEWLAMVAPNATARPTASVASAAAAGRAVDTGHYVSRRFYRAGWPRFLAAAGIGGLPVFTALESETAVYVSAAAALIGAAGWIAAARLAGAADMDWQRRFGGGIILWVLGGLAAGAVAGLVPVLVRGVPGIGLVLIAWMFAVVWTTDIAAYFVGRAIGGPKLWQRVSPNKTWAGFWGGAIGGSAAGWLVLTVAGIPAGDAPPAWGTALAISFLASIIGQGGDLAESALKRRAGVKDSGRIVPGHGGVLDRVDSFLAVCVLVAIGLATVAFVP